MKNPFDICVSRGLTRKIRLSFVFLVDYLNTKNSFVVPVSLGLPNTNISLVLSLLPLPFSQTTIGHTQVRNTR